MNIVKACFEAESVLLSEFVCVTPFAVLLFCLLANAVCKMSAQPVVTFLCNVCITSDHNVNQCKIINLQTVSE